MFDFSRPESEHWPRQAAAMCTTFNDVFTENQTIQFPWCEHTGDTTAHLAGSTAAVSTDNSSKS
jgi:hypothetical protein